MASSLKEFSTTAGSNTAIGSASIAENCAPSGINNGLREIIAYIIDWFMNSGTIASATTTDLGTKTQNYLSVTGTTTITGLGTPTNLTEYTLTFAGILTLTHNATSLILPGGANITTAAGDVAVMKHEGSGNWRCLFYQPASGQPVAVVTSFAPAAISGRTEITSVDGAADFVAVWDATDSLVKKVKPDNLGSSISFSAHKNASNQGSITNITDIKLTFTTEVFDVGGYYDAANSKFLPLVAGKYFISGAANWVSSGFGDAKATYIAIFKNGSILHQGPIVNSRTSTDFGVHVQGVVDLNGSTDYVELYIWQNNGDARTVDGAIVKTYFQGFKI